MTAATPLSTRIDAAWAGHAADPEGHWRQLAADTPALCAGAQAADLDALLRVAEHLALAHRADPAGLLDWLPPLQAAAATWASLAAPLKRVQAAIALAQGRTPEWSDLVPAEQVRAHANAAIGRAVQGDCAGARALLEQATDCTGRHDGDPQAGRALAALAHNLAAHLREGPNRDAQATDLMIEAATRSRTAWTSVGGWLEIERADWHLAMCHAAAGQGEDALFHARATLAACEAHGADGFEFCFAWQALAEAALAAGQPELARQAREAMAARQAEVTDPGFAAYAAAQLAAIDARLA